MVLIKCSECDQMVTEQAVTCPRCGSGIARRQLPEASTPHSSLIITHKFLDSRLQKITKAEMMCRLFSML